MVQNQKDSFRQKIVVWHFEKKIFVIFKKMQILQFINDVVFLTNVLNVQSVTSEINSFGSFVRTS